MDTVHEKLNPWKIDKYNEETCKLEGHLLPAKDLMIDGKVNQDLHGGVWISIDDYKAVMKYTKTACQNKKVRSSNGGTP